MLHKFSDIKEVSFVLDLPVPLDGLPSTPSDRSWSTLAPTGATSAFALAPSLQPEVLQVAKF